MFGHIRQINIYNLQTSILWKITKPRVGVSNFAQKFSFFSTFANFNLKKGAQFERNQGPLNEISFEKKIRDLPPKLAMY